MYIHSTKSSLAVSQRKLCWIFFTVEVSKHILVYVKILILFMCIRRWVSPRQTSGHYEILAMCVCLIIAGKGLTR